MKFSRFFFVSFFCVSLTACGGGSGSSEIGPGSGNPNIPTGPELTGSVSLRWDIPVTKDNGDPLSMGEIDGYKIYLTKNSNSYPSTEYVDVVDNFQTEITINDIPAGKYYIYVTTYDTNGDESAFSDPVIATI